MPSSGVVIAVHGGAGRPRAGGSSEPQVHAALRDALARGHAALADGGAALDAVQAAVLALENEPIFNAGYGAVLNAAGRVELDASIMCGRTAAAGAVGAVSGLPHPVALARSLLDEGRHALLVGPAAAAAARERGLEVVGDDDLVTEEQRRRWRESSGGGASTPGTVGAVARDRHGHLAAATSTGGVRGKLPGRVGDSALPGAGTWARDGCCAVSLTGDGDGIVRAAAAHELAALVAHAGLELGVAARTLIHEQLASVGVDAGLVAVDARGQVVMAVNCGLMYRGVHRMGGAPRTAVAASEGPFE